MKKIHSPLVKWLINRFGGTSDKDAIANIIRELLEKNGQNKLPTRLSDIAICIGINPNPIYKNQTSVAQLVVINDEFRITLRMKTEKPPSVYWHGFPRLRFAYAHELIHCLNYDLSCRPPKRIAPRAMKNEEEEICNYGAGLLVLPVHLVKEYLATLENVDFISKATLLATKSQTSLHASVLHLINEGYLDDSKNKIYIFSQNSEGYHGRGIKKPRCIISIIYLNDDPRKYFLPVYKGLEALGVSFSLIKFHDNMFENSSLSEIKINNEIIRFSGKAFLLEGYHRRVGNSGYVWSDLSVLELETK